MALVFSWFVVVLRACWCVCAMLYSPVGFCLGCVELFCLLMTCRGLLAGGVDRSLLGMLLPLCYLAPCLLRVNVPLGFSFGLVVWFVAVVVRLFVLWFLGSSVSVGVAVFPGVRSRGTSGVVRPPLGLVAVTSVVGILFAAFCWWNVGVVCVCVLASVLSVVLEERFLFWEWSYASYASMVKYRWIPGVW